MFFLREKTDNSGIYESILLTQLPIFNNGIPYLAPGNNIHLYLGELKDKQLEITPRIKVYFNYKTETGKFISNDVIFDFTYLAKNDL